MPAAEATYPGGSKSRVIKAGKAVRDGIETEDDLAVINTWRSAHKAVLNTFQAILRNRTRDTDVVVAQRHKRKNTIFNKLRRLRGMDLARMDDVAGCRLIFPNLQSLTSFRAAFHKAKFNHVLRNDVDKYDYIKNPKSTGYRGIHDVYEYDVASSVGQSSKGLLIELQYRTAIQHAWATAVEVIGFITSSQPKFQQGDKRYETAMAYASEIIARSHEGTTSCFPDMPDDLLMQEFFRLDLELGLMNALRRLNAADNKVASRQNFILIFSEDEPLEVMSFESAPKAMAALFDLEKSSPGKDIVLVRADSGEAVRTAFRNYFSDAKDFIYLIQLGYEKLSAKVIEENLRKAGFT